MWFLAKLAQKILNNFWYTWLTYKVISCNLQPCSCLSQFLVAFEHCIFYFRDSFFNYVSIIYGIAVINIGLIVYLFNFFGKRSENEAPYFSDIYNLILSIIGICIISWFLYDIHKYKISLKNHYNLQEEKEEMPEKEENLSISMPTTPRITSNHGSTLTFRRLTSNQYSYETPALKEAGPKFTE